MNSYLHYTKLLVLCFEVRESGVEVEVEWCGGKPMCDAHLLLRWIKFIFSSRHFSIYQGYEKKT